MHDVHYSILLNYGYSELLLLDMKTMQDNNFIKTQKIISNINHKQLKNMKWLSSFQKNS